MRKYQMTALYVVCAVVFTTIAILTANRVIIAILFLMLLGFIAVSDRASPPSRPGKGADGAVGGVDPPASGARGKLDRAGSPAHRGNSLTAAEVRGRDYGVERAMGIEPT